jgi:hypothetical protein
MKDHSSKPIVHCKHNVFGGKPDLEGQLPKFIDQNTINTPLDASDVITHDSDVAMEDITEGYPHIPGIHLHKLSIDILVLMHR